jgi:hypothetical protein
MKYLVIEIQTNADGTVGNLVFAYDDRNQAESKYHAVLAAAAISELPMHTCDLIQADGILLARQCYVHEQEAVEGEMVEE